MIRKLLATTALTAIMTTGAFAQATTNTNANAGAQNGTPVFNYDMQVTTQNQNQAQTPGTGYIESMQGQVLASQLMGKPVYNSPAKDAKTIGNVNDLVMSPNGSAEAVLVGVGGFLGIGEKQVAVDFRQLNWVMVDGELRLVLNTSEEQLKNAPAFDTSKLKAGQQMQSDAQNQTNVQVQTDNTQTNANANANAQTQTQTTTQVPAQTTTQVPAQDNKANSNANNANAQAQTNANANSAVVNQTQGLQNVDMATLSADKIMGARVHDGNNDDIGEVGDVLLTTDNKIEAYVVDVGGFLGLGEKPVAIAAKSLKIMADANGNLIIFTPFTQDQLNNAPTYSADAYKADPNKVVVK